jgi:hypothetical protein
MKAAAALVKQLRQMSVPEAHTRRFRALFVAQALAYHVPVQAGKSLDEVHQQHEKPFLALLNDVNEYLPVDTRLARELFRRLLKGRLELLNGFTDISLLKALLASDTQLEQLPPETAGVMDNLLSQPQFAQAQYAIHELVADVYAPAE